MESPEKAPLSISFVRALYDGKVELERTTTMGMLELEGYVVELRDSVYRSNLKAGEAPKYHRRLR